MASGLEIQNYNWGGYDFSKLDIQVLDTSLRDGLQGGNIKHPNRERKAELLSKMIKSGVDAIDIAIPIARRRHLREAKELVKLIPANIRITCLARTQEQDIKAALELAESAGRPIETIIFCGASQVRMWVEGWNVDQLRDWMSQSVSLATREGLIANVATEHTTQADPEAIKEIYKAGLDAGGKMVCIADTSGAADPLSTSNLVHFFREEVIPGYGDIPIDWHGHNDRGLAVANSLAAIQSGASRIHTTMLGIGERAGNTPFEQVMVNLKIAGDPKRGDISAITEVSKFSAKIFGRSIPVNSPVIGEGIFTTGSGIHAAAELKARELSLSGMTPYSIIHPGWIGRETDVVVGPLSGAANVIWVTRRLGLEYSEALETRLLDIAQRTNDVLTDEQVVNIAHDLVQNNGGINGGK